jgi:hypothetical protein
MLTTCNIKTTSAKNEEWGVLRARITPYSIHCVVMNGKVVRMISLAKVIEGGGFGKQA